MEYRITIDLDNAAFEDNPNELARILESLAEPTYNHHEAYTGPLKDINGNTVGQAEIKEA